MSQNGSDVVIAAPPAGAVGEAPTPYGEAPAGDVAVVHLGVAAAPRVLVGMLLDGTPVLYEQR